MWQECKSELSRANLRGMGDKVKTKASHKMNSQSKNKFRKPYPKRIKSPSLEKSSLDHCDSHTDQGNTHCQEGEDDGDDDGDDANPGSTHSPIKPRLAAAAADDAEYSELLQAEVVQSVAVIQIQAGEEQELQQPTVVSHDPHSSGSPVPNFPHPPQHVQAQVHQRQLEFLSQWARHRSAFHSVQSRLRHYHPPARKIPICPWGLVIA